MENDTRLFGKDYPHLCTACRAQIDLAWELVAEGPDTDDDEAACLFIYDNRLYCQGHECRGRLVQILEGMEIPTGRYTDFEWLNRNLGIHNGDNPDYEEAMQLIRATLKWQRGE